MNRTVALTVIAATTALLSAGCSAADSAEPSAPAEESTSQSPSPQEARPMEGEVVWASPELVVTRVAGPKDAELTGYSPDGERLWSRSRFERIGSGVWFWEADGVLAVRDAYLDDGTRTTLALLDPRTGEVVAADSAEGDTGDLPSAEERLTKRTRDWATTQDAVRAAHGGPRVFVDADTLSHPVAVVHALDWVKATNMQTGEETAIACEDGSTVLPTAVTWLRADGAYAQLDERIVLDTRSMEVSCFGAEEDEDLLVEDVSAEGHVLQRDDMDVLQRGGKLSVVTLQGGVAWTAPEALGTVIGARFVDEDTLAVSEREGQNVTTHVVELEG